MTAGASWAAEAAGTQQDGTAGSRDGQVPTSQSRSAPQTSHVRRISVSIPHVAKKKGADRMVRALFRDSLGCLEVGAQTHGMAVLGQDVRGHLLQEEVAGE